MKVLVLSISILISLNAYSTVYQTEENGVPGFSNIKSKNSRKLNMQSDPI
ncbi:hypothetical protein fh0823_00940 [Francisella halioticida]|nr:hypothetical protein [Francisella halioticida]BCD89955.1 hypothetical protein fh0823_00940 [Francisella halioticida]